MFFFFDFFIGNILELHPADLVIPECFYRESSDFEARELTNESNDPGFPLNPPAAECGNDKPMELMEELASSMFNSFRYPSCKGGDERVAFGGGLKSKKEQVKRNK